jgi:Protein of unknown function (DUF1549)/Protein of unknown function (DUF1553)
MARGRPSPCLLGGALILLTQLAGGARAVEPLHRKIDRMVDAKLEAGGAEVATDAEFMRRVCLDLGGMIPSSVDARAFLDDPSAYKRRRLIERLLASPAYARRMEGFFDLMLMERREDVHVPAREWRAFLRRAFAENTPYNRLVAQILSVDGTEPDQRAAAKFYLDRLADPNLLTRDIGRMFLGRDMQCAQCHDHPLIDDYKQAHYYGLYAFLSRTTVFDDSTKGPVLAEKAEGDVTFTSVFKKKVSHKTGPRILDGPESKEPSVPKGAEYLLAPDKENKVRTIPRHSRRAELPGRITSGSIPEFDRNIVNRLWALMMGRGLVHPVDLHHADNPPADPELLDVLAREFVAMKYDVKAFLRELALSRVYQRSSERPPDASASAGDEAEATGELAVAPLKPLEPEQLAWSAMRGLGLVAMAQQRAIERLDGHDPKMRAIFQTDAKRRALRETTLEELVRDELQGNVTPFVHQFASAAGQPQIPTEPTVHQALFLSNGHLIQAWLAPSAGFLVGRLAGLADPFAVADELYVSLLSRRPTVEERDEVERYLKERGKDRVPALQELAWALLASTEFRFNH